MIFQHTIDKVLSGEKTQTRRLVKDGEFAANKIGLYIGDINAHNKRFGDLWDLKNPYRTSDYGTMVMTPASRVKWQIGVTYAIQPGRGKPAVARMRITDIRREDVREISAADIKAEGFETASDFFITWCKMHDTGQTLPIIPDYFTGSIVWQGVRAELCQRPAERYQAWAISFEVVK